MKTKTWEPIHSSKISGASLFLALVIATVPAYIYTESPDYYMDKEYWLIRTCTHVPFLKQKLPHSK